MHTTLTNFAAVAVLLFGMAFALLMFFMAVVQPIWSVIDCAVDTGRGSHAEKHACSLSRW